MNMAIGIRLKIDTSGLQQKCFSGDFPQLLELRLLRTHMGGSFQSVCLQNIHKVSRKNQCEAARKLKEQLFPETHFACLSFRLVQGLLLFPHKNIERSE